MKKRRLGNSDLYVSEIGLGCMSLGTDYSKAEDIVHEALDSGINYLDTADLYDYGQNEEIVGQAVKGRRDEVIIGSKVGNKFTPGEEGWTWDPSKKHIKEGVKSSLKRLGVDYIDLYQLHGGTIEDPIEESIQAFDELIDEGLIRAYGISSIRPNVIKQYVEKSNIVSIMMQYNAMDRRPEELLDYLADHDISVLARGHWPKVCCQAEARKKPLQKLTTDTWNTAKMKSCPSLNNGHPSQVRIKTPKRLPFSTCSITLPWPQPFSAPARPTNWPTA